MAMGGGVNGCGGLWVVYVECFHDYPFLGLVMGNILLDIFPAIAVE